MRRKQNTRGSLLNGAGEVETEFVEDDHYCGSEKREIKQGLRKGHLHPSLTLACYSLSKYLLSFPAYMLHFVIILSINFLFV